MKKLIVTLSIAAMAFALTSCGKHGASHSEHMAEATKDKPVLSADYPLDVCVVSGEKLSGSMGATIVINHNGQEVGFCCKDCVNEFNKNPEKYLAIINEAKAKKEAEKKQ